MIENKLELAISVGVCVLYDITFCYCEVIRTHLREKLTVKTVLFVLTYYRKQ